MKAKKPCNYYDYQRLTLKNHFQYFGSLFPCRDKSIYLTLKSEIINSLDLGISYPLEITPFTETFGDNCAGVFCRLTITTNNNIGTCNEY